MNYQVIELGEISRANDNPRIRISELLPEDAVQAGKYDMLFINGMGLRITEEQRQAVKDAAEKGLPVVTTMVTNPANDINSMDSTLSVEVKAYLLNGGRTNYRNMLNYVRKHVDRKVFSAPEPGAVVEYRTENIYRPDLDGGEEKSFTSIAAYEVYLKAAGLYSDDAPRIIITGQMGDATELVRSLEVTGNLTYPIRNIRNMIRNGQMDSIAPSAIINMAHGRMGDETVEYLKKRNIPLFAPLNVNSLVSEWEQDPMGMSGGFMSQSIVTPEIDGAIRPFVIFGHYEGQDGLRRLDAIPGRLEEFVETVNRHIALKSTPNAEKKVAVFYYKGAGQNALTAAGMEVIPSLYNFLKYLKDNGYYVSGLPSSPEALGELIMKKGALFGSYAEGAASRFMQEGDPEWVDSQTYSEWVSDAMPADLYGEVVALNGEFPGPYMSDGGRMAVSRVKLGNVVLLPQPAAGGGENDFAMVHGTGSAPPHNYIAAYLYARYGFGADVMIHFGTHGSLEFTPRKQVALSDYDWPDRLIGPLPHVYLYTIGDVGEGIIAKRRSYAELLSHLTAPFMESNVSGMYQDLIDLFAEYDKAFEQDIPDTGTSDGISLKIKKLCIEMGISADLGLDTLGNGPYTSDEIFRIENFAEELVSEKVSGRLYVLGEKYEDEQIISTVYAMCTEPVAYGLFCLDKAAGKADDSVLNRMPEFNRRYLEPARKIVGRLLAQGRPADDRQLCSIAGITSEELARAREVYKSLQTPPDMMTMMMSLAEEMGSGAETASKDESKPVPSHGTKISGMMEKAGKGMDPEKALKIAKAMGASEESLKKMESAMDAVGQSPRQAHGSQDAHSDQAVKNGASAGNMSDMMSAMGLMPGIANNYSSAEKDYARAVFEIEQAVLNVYNYKKQLETSPGMELESAVNALNGGYVAPSPGGDPVANPNTLPTGRNLFAINAEATPTRSAWEKGKQLAQNTIDLYRSRHNDSIPRKVSYTLWSGEFIETEGATIAQILYMLGVEPVYDSFGRVTDIRLISSEQLNRPRIDVVVQTSGQLRDLAASRLFLIDRAVRMAAAVVDEPYVNNVAEGIRETERVLIEKGVTPKQAREMSAYRVFGGINGSYGTGIQGMIEASDRWSSESEIAQVYLNNMGAYYGSEEDWEKFMNFAFEAALSRTDAVVQPRQSNTWGALSLDHVYEFMGGLNLAVREVTGKDPDAYLSDYRNRNRVRMQDVKEAIGVESRTTILNPSYIREKMKGGAGDADAIAETVMNTFGWNVMRPTAVDDRLWDEIYEVYVNDKYDLGIQRYFEDMNPAALEEITAIMLETVRKGMWDATEQQIKDMAELHTGLIEKYRPSCSGFVCDNPSLKDYIASNVAPEKAEEYTAAIKDIRETTAGASSGMVLKKDRMNEEVREETALVGNIAVAVSLVVVFIAGGILIRRRRNSGI